MKVKAKDIMTREVVTVPGTMTVREVVKLLAEKRLHGVPVVDNWNNLAGIVTESDIISQDKDIHITPFGHFFNRVLEFFVATEKQHERFLKGGAPSEEELKTIFDSRVKDIMISDVVTIEEETGIEKICSIMSDKKIHLLPVVRGKEVVGVVGKYDIIKALMGSI